MELFWHCGRLVLLWTLFQTSGFGFPLFLITCQSQQRFPVHNTLPTPSIFLVKQKQKQKIRPDAPVSYPFDTKRWVAAPERKHATNIQATSIADSKSQRIQELQQSFISQMSQSLQKNTFVSLTLRGPSAKKKKKRQSINGSESESERIRGCIKQVQGRRIHLKKGNREFLQMTFKFHLATDVAKNWPLATCGQSESDVSRIEYGLWAILNPSLETDWSDDEKEQIRTEYIPKSEWGDQQQQLQDPNNELGIQRATLVTTTHQYDLDVAASTKKPTLQQSKLTKKVEAPQVSQHDQVKQVPLNNQASFLQALGVTHAHGKPRRAMASKLRQCQKFVEIVDTLVDRVYTVANASQEQEQPAIRVLDMGCGRGYLTFAVHAFLEKKFGNCNNSIIQSTGIDVRPKLVAEINGIARSLGDAFRHLHFEEGTIESIMLQNTEPASASSSESSIDILIALHACDTATDDALWTGISRQADIIVVAPCCHQQIRPQLNAHLSKTASKVHPLADILRHNIYKERQAEMVTDAMRALLLELAGYQVQVFEFIGGEHTAKNVMITAVRQATNNSDAIVQSIRQRLEELASLHGVTKQRLAQWMGSKYLGEESIFLNEAPTMEKPAKLSSKRMPPL